MSLQSVKSFLAEHAPDIAVIELEASTATVGAVRHLEFHEDVKRFCSKRTETYGADRSP